MTTATHTLTLAAFGDALFAQAVAAKEVSLKEVMGSEVLELYREGVLENFKSATDPDGKAWPPRKHQYPHPILVKTGAMQEGALGEGAGFVMVEDLSVSITDPVEHAKFHEFGTSRLPARSFMGLKDEKKDAIGDAIRDDIAKQIWGAE